jgi:hypothetical protein
MNPMASVSRAPRLVFGMTSATERPEVIEQLVDTLGGRPVVLHHDFGRQPGLRLNRPNVHFVTDVHATAWGSWGLCLAVLSTIRYALQRLEFDYFQLLSPSCLPLHPIAEFESRLAASPFEGHADLVDIRNVPDYFANYGWRMYAPKGSLRQRVLSRARRIYFGPDAERVQGMGLAVLSDARSEPSLRDVLAKQLAIGTIRTMSLPAISGAPFGPGLRAHVGSLWFGASRALCEDIVRGMEDPRIVGYFRRLHIPDEMVFPTIIANTGRRIGAANHWVNTFNDRGNPRTFKPGDLDALLASDASFARKFPGNPAAPLRTALISRRGLIPGASRNSVRAGTPKVVFGTMLNAPGSVSRLAAALQGRPLVVHAGPGVPRPSLPAAANVEIASPPLTGGFRPIALNAGLLQLLKYCVECLDFDYLQLLPPDAVPLRPIDAFEGFVAAAGDDAHAQVLSLRTRQAFARHAARACVHPGSPFAPMLRWAGACHPEPGQPTSLRERAGALVVGAAAALLPIRQRALRGLAPAVGSRWFGASRDACAHLVRYATEPRWVDYATAIEDDGEVLFATLLLDGTFTIGPSNLASGPDVDGARAWFRSGAERALDARQPIGHPVGGDPPTDRLRMPAAGSLDSAG